MGSQINTPLTAIKQDILGRTAQKKERACKLCKESGHEEGRPKFANIAKKKRQQLSSKNHYPTSIHVSQEEREGILLQLNKSFRYGKAVRNLRSDVTVEIERGDNPVMESYSDKSQVG